MEWMDGWMKEGRKEQMDGWMDGWMDGRKEEGEELQWRIQVMKFDKDLHYKEDMIEK